MSTASRNKHAMRRVAFGLAGALGLALVAYLVHASSIGYPRAVVSFESDPGTWRGAFHVHTTASDGSGTIEDIVQAARAGGAAWVLVADHNRMEPQRARIVDGVLLVFAPEIGTADGHVTAVGVSRALSLEERRASSALSTITSLGGASVAAHPLGRKRPYRRLEDPGLAGLEILSADQEFRDALVSPRRFVPAALAYPVNPTHAVMRLVQRPDRTLARWDELLGARRMAGFCAIDAHGRPAYDVMMRILQMYVVVGRARSGDAPADAAALFDALTRGRSYCGIDALAGAGGFRFSAVTGTGEVPMGDDVRLDRQPLLRVDLLYEALPPGVAAYAVCGGNANPLVPARTGRGWRYEYRPVRPGACRVELRMTDGSGRVLPWVFSNPVYVR